MSLLASSVNNSQSVQSAPANMRQVIAKWGLPLISLAGYFTLVTITFTLPATAINKGRAAVIGNLVVMGQGAALVAVATAAATLVKVAEVAKTTCFNSWNEAKKRFSDAIGVDGLIRNTLLPFSGIYDKMPALSIYAQFKVPRMLREALDASRQANNL